MSIRPELDAELEEAISALRSSRTIAELSAASVWIKRILQQMWDESVR